MHRLETGKQEKHNRKAIESDKIADIGTEQCEPFFVRFLVGMMVELREDLLIEIIIII